MRFLVRCLLAFVVALPAAAAEAPKLQERPNLTVLADGPVLLALAPLARLYASDHGTPLTVAIKDADYVEEQIEQGIEAHVIITAHRDLMNRLTDQGLTDVTSRRVIGKVPLALVTSSQLNRGAQVAERISFAAMLYATPNQPVLSNSIDSLDGALAQKLTAGHEFSANLAGRLRVEPDRDELVEQLRDSDALALMLASDALAEPDLSVLATLPESVSPPVVFEAAVLGGESMEEARRFVAFLASRQAQEILARYGLQAAK